MKTYRPIFITSLLFALLLSTSFGRAELLTTNEPPVEVLVPSSGGSVRGWTQLMKWPRARGGEKPWIAYIRTYYLPETGNGWAGGVEVDRVIFADDCIFGILYEPLQGNPMLTMSVSTNKYGTGLKDVAVVMQAEFTRYTKSIESNIGLQYSLRLEKIFGPSVVRDARNTNDFIWGGFSLETRPSKLDAVSAEGTNAVVAIQFGTNMLTKIAFNKWMRPVWATTNGVSIGIIPTNSVFFSDVISNRLVLKVVY